MLFVCQLCGSEHASSGALRVHRSKVHRKEKASPHSHTHPPVIDVEVISPLRNVVEEEAPRHRQLPKVVFVESVAERRRNWELEDPVIRAGIADLKHLIYLNKVLRIKKAIDEERMKLERLGLLHTATGKQTK